MRMVADRANNHPHAFSFDVQDIAVSRMSNPLSGWDVETHPRKGIAGG
jgi:hypothetical protein